MQDEMELKRMEADADQQAADFLIRAVRSDMSRTPGSLQNYVFLDDVRMLEAEMAGHWQLVKSMGIDTLPVVRGETIAAPVSLRCFRSWDEADLYSAVTEHDYIGFRKRLELTGLQDYLDMEPVDEVRNLYDQNLRDIVTRRMKLLREKGPVWPPEGTETGRFDANVVPPAPPSVSAPGCLFEVNTSTVGLRVFWSGDVVISPNWFGAPTSPVQARLPTGRYVFGVDGKHYGPVVRWDLAAVATCPGKVKIALNY